MAIAGTKFMVKLIVLDVALNLNILDAQVARRIYQAMRNFADGVA